ncbi:hypothetical protein DTL42_25625 [Bremerella cremea]|uniref:Uncharacterized protein n=1 Tax=Bremerella cremea TaxID=1031537 RepID=A0A368KN40_9BACT|nr:hypothetical protein [Bremerella cremea]RCS40745.1 hypothetical protein DTL42_25625 [Bremerella cremea]
MSVVDFDILEHPQFLEFIMSGDPTEEQWVELLRRIVEELERRDKSRVLVDASAMTTMPSSMVRYRMGLRTGESLHLNARIAVLYPQNKDDNFWETVATNRGALARSGISRAELVAWLLREDVHL